MLEDYAFVIELISLKWGTVASAAGVEAVLSLGQREWSWLPGCIFFEMIKYYSCSFFFKMKLCINGKGKEMLQHLFLEYFNFGNALYTWSKVYEMYNSKAMA